MVVRDNDDISMNMVRRLLHVLDSFRRVRQTLPVHLVTALLRVAADAGKSVNHYGRESGVSLSVMSRHLLDLGTEFRNGEQGLGLIEKRRSPTSLREYEVYLTPKGRKVVKEAVELLMTGIVVSGEGSENGTFGRYG